MSWFRRNKTPEGLTEEQALAMLETGQWQCSSCGIEHSRQMDLAAMAPNPWPHDEVYRPNSKLTLEGDFLSEGFCVMEGRYFFVRSVLRLPVCGMDWSFGFGCWGSLSRANFELYVQHFDDGAYAGLGPWGSWLCNFILPFMDGATDFVDCDMVPQLDRNRPLLLVADGNHPLAKAQDDGITALQLVEIWAQYGHDWRQS